MNNEKIDEIMEQIEDEELLKLAEARIAAHGGEEEAFRNAIPAEEVYRRLGITEEDIENAEDVEFEVKAL